MNITNGRPAWATFFSIATLLLWLCAAWVSARAQPVDLDPSKIRVYLMDNPGIDSADKFLKNLPAEFKKDWFMITNTESAQEGTAISPRFIVPNADASRVFGFALDSPLIEYIEFDAATNKFRFHEITMRGGGNGGSITIDDPRCSGCHASRRPGVAATTTGPRPNWDAYDSWAGMLPFNRDRIYQHAKVNGTDEESVEATAIKRIFKALKLKGDPIYKELTTAPDGMLPNGITQDATTGDVTFAFAACDPGITGPQPCKTDPDAGPVDVKFDQDAAKNVSYPGPKGPISVTQGGKYLRLQHSGKGAATDEGRGVALFDNFTPNNAKRVAQELADFPRNPVDVRYVALAIANKCVTPATLGKYAPKEALTKMLAFQKNLDPGGTVDPEFPTGNIDTFPKLLADTRKRMENLPKLKANLQATNLMGLILENNNAKCTANGAPFACCSGAGAGTCQSIDNAACTANAAPLACCTGPGAGTCDFTAERITANIARRSRTNPPIAPNPGQIFEPAKITPFMIDREFYDRTDETLRLAMFRLYLEPVGVAVDTWSMSVKRRNNLTGRNRTYTFGDLFSSPFGFYIKAMDEKLRKDLLIAPLPTPVKCGELAANSIKQFVKF